MYCIAVTLMRVRAIMLEREGHAGWALAARQSQPAVTRSQVETT
jgi:hypothetical protein